MKAFATAFALGLILAGPAAGDGPVTRDERAVKVDGVEETWRLEWLGAPRLVCQPLDLSWPSCSCSGFAFGEAGGLDLVRLRDAGEIDRFHLTLFSNADVPPFTRAAAIAEQIGDEPRVVEVGTGTLRTIEAYLREIGV